MEVGVNMIFIFVFLGMVDSWLIAAGRCEERKRSGLFGNRCHLRMKSKIFLSFYYRTHILGVLFLSSKSLFIFLSSYPLYQFHH